MQNKKCAHCGIVKNIREFTRKKSSKDGFNSSCKICTREIVRKHYYKNRKYYINKSKKTKLKFNKYIWELKKDKGCYLCNNKNPYLLDFHHIKKREKKYTISKIVTYKRLALEIDKCILLCRNCHAEFHYYTNNSENSAKNLIDEDKVEQIVKLIEYSEKGLLGD